MIVFAQCFRLLAVGVNKLLVAASDGDYDAVMELVTEQGFSPSHDFHLGVTAIHEACNCRHVEVARLLIELGADVNKQVQASFMVCCCILL